MAVNKIPAPKPETQFVPAALDRLKAADKAISEMAPAERRAAFGWLRSKYEAEWPRDPTF